MDSMERVGPALTPGEWEDRCVLIPAIGGRMEAVRQIAGDNALAAPGLYVDARVASHIPPEAYHGVAALALRGQPFGFTWDDVRALRGAAETSDLWEDPAEWSDGTPVLNRALTALVDRIAALLPPETP